MNWNRIWECVIIGGFLMLIGFGVFFGVMGLMVGESLTKKIEVTQLIKDYEKDSQAKLEEFRSGQQDMDERINALSYVAEINSEAYKGRHQWTSINTETQSR